MEATDADLNELYAGIGEAVVHALLTDQPNYARAWIEELKARAPESEYVLTLDILPHSEYRAVQRQIQDRLGGNFLMTGYTLPYLHELKSYTFRVPRKQEDRNA